MELDAEAERNARAVQKLAAALADILDQEYGTSSALRYKASRFPADFAELMRGRGSRKVLFGTNYPMLTASACLERLASLGLSADAQQLFLSRNARRVFKLDDAG